MDVLKLHLETSANVALTWFEKNQMKANPSKFQAIVFTQRKSDDICDLIIGNVLVKTVPHVKLLGVTIDESLRCC